MCFKNIFNNFSVLNVTIGVCLKRVHELVLNTIKMLFFLSKFTLKIEVVFLSETLKTYPIPTLHQKQEENTR
jgi:hypothetical protein